MSIKKTFSWVIVITSMVALFTQCGDKEINVDRVTLDKTAATLEVGGMITLKATIEPNNATNKTVTWTSGNKEIATVFGGVVTGVSVGKATITATAGGKSATASITVKSPFVAVERIMLDKTQDTLEVNATLTFTATIEPTNATDKTIIWTSSNIDVAGVSANGVVRGVSEGTATITAMAAGNQSATATATVTVIRATDRVAITSLEVNPEQGNVEMGSTLTLMATIQPNSATDKTLTWISSDDNIATVDADGMVRGVSEGTAIITVTTVSGGLTAMASITVTPAIVAPTGVTLTPTQDSVEMLSTVTLMATVEPANATDTRVTWSSDDENIATVDADGMVRGVSEGTAIITVTTVSGGLTAMASITVTPAIVAPTGVTLTPTQDSVEMLSTVTLMATVEPANATDNRVTWSSDDESIATVDTDGVVTGISVGTATITATTVSGGFTATSLITVLLPSPNSVELNEQSADLLRGDSFTLVATVLPMDAADRTVTWTSSDAGVATVDSNGVVTGVSLGIVMITATTVSGGLTAMATLRVVNVLDAPPNTNVGITVTPVSSTILMNDSVTLVAAVSPATLSDKRVRWQSTNPAIATVDDQGVVRSFGLTGQVTIIATTVVGGISIFANITVDNPIVLPTGVTITPDSTTVEAGSSVTLMATVSPADATNNRVTWSSDDESVATVGADGVVTGVSAGTAMITATTELGAVTATAIVVVPFVEIAINPIQASILAGSATTFTATVNVPGNTGVIWMSSDTSIATVDANGVVTGIAMGRATITATINSGADTFMARATVLVLTNPPVSIVINPPTTTTVSEGDSLVLIASVAPDIPATDMTIEWTSSDTNIATVDANGMVVGVSAGTVSIFATSRSAQISTTIGITVTSSP